MLADLARAAAQGGDLARAGTLAKKALAAARTITDPAWQAQALAKLVRELAADDLSGAEVVSTALAAVEAITDTDQRAQVLADLARAAAEAGDLDRAGTLADRALAAAESITSP